MNNTNLDLVIVGGGIMGLFTAYYASLANVKKIMVLEKYIVGNSRRKDSDPKSASFSLTRSIRNDYIDPYYARLAYEARALWLDVQNKSNKKLIVDAGCLNITKNSITPNIEKTYAYQSLKTLKNLNLKNKRFSKNLLDLTFPQFIADFGTLDVEAGFLDVSEITKTLLELLKEKQVEIIENAQIKKISQRTGTILITVNTSTISTKKLVITSGLWTNDVLKTIEDCKIRFPLKATRPEECKYYIPPPYKRDLFTPDRLPVFAYLDIGIYGHPILEGKTPGVKIGFYNPPDIRKIDSKIKSISDFIKECMPSLLDAQVMVVTDTDQCSYDMVKDKNFIVGTLPGFPNIVVGAGWNGTGYKFAPLIGKILAGLAFQGKTIYDISRFSIDRFKT